VTPDFNAKEITAVRGALNFLHRRCGTWATLGRALSFKGSTLGNVARGNKAVSATLVIRVAKLAGVRVDDLLSGQFPAKCPHCGAVKEEGE
jgi:hypothetical protein